MKIAILDAKTLGADLSLEPVQTLGKCMVYDGTEPWQVAERIQDAEIVLINKVKLHGGVLKDATSLKLICLAATGYDNVDLEYCREHNIAVCNVVGYSSHSVSQVTAAMVLALSVHLKPYDAYVSSGSYTQSGVANKLTPIYHELYGKTWGIIGYGSIGKEVGAVANALGCRVLVHKRTPSDECNCVTLEELCRESDVISIHTPLSDDTRGMIGKEQIELMKENVILVNTARGAVTDEEAVCEAVLNGRIGAFGTDVYSVEPFPAEHPFCKIKDLPNVYLTPHMAWGAYESRCRCLAEISENIRAFYAGKTRNRVV
ncbi:MAG: hydroxyacid dehydrogenase [Clostridia bacterium]|nr:hydroxyacid dehydrogenase [Clostridia bacterium]